MPPSPVRPRAPRSSTSRARCVVEGPQRRSPRRRPPRPSEGRQAALDHGRAEHLDHPRQEGRPAGRARRRQEGLGHRPRDGGRVEVVVEGKSRWVTTGYLTNEKPPDAGRPLHQRDLGAERRQPVDRASPQRGLRELPGDPVYGTFRGGGGTTVGRAVDIMVSGARGQQIADFVRENYAALGVSYVIFCQHIWSVERPARAGVRCRAAAPPLRTTTTTFTYPSTDGSVSGWSLLE